MIFSLLLLPGDEIHIYSVMEKVGEGAFATIYLVACLDALDMTDLDCDFRRVALKIQHPPCPREIKELHARLSRLPSQIDVRQSIMTAECAHIYQDKSCMVTEYKSKGILLNLFNKVKAVNKKDLSHSEDWVMFFAIKILQVVEYMHRCKIIHGDVKPDNFLINTEQ
ncbi:checkpoint serine/threonine-protein kinase bub1 [Strongylocentrotus purpuratus]|uniref:Protein kinase domain-containing protein n=1 Tax=Strongylocentrotus purpuratus TaxID=7668 RepID=A0A7M7NDF5_STRPU|nr:checkpoint serine/threonine-protein kinase bub1 [Strongylocentrotus purpuratus]